LAGRFRKSRIGELGLGVEQAVDQGAQLVVGAGSALLQLALGELPAGLVGVGVNQVEGHDVHCAASL
jgi:hypothetical protein